jgi:hypothetical protein
VPLRIVASWLTAVEDDVLGQFRDEENYPDLIGPRGAEPSITAACVFVDLMADLAVLGPPDDQELFDECEAYKAFTAALPPFDIAAPPHAVSFPAHLLSLEGAWLDCTASNHGGRERGGTKFAGMSPLVIEPEDIVVAGMSGSPLISATGAALGVICMNNVATTLADGLPGWLLRKLACC